MEWRPRKTEEACISQSRKALHSTQRRCKGDKRPPSVDYMVHSEPNGAIWSVTKWYYRTYWYLSQVESMLAIEFTLDVSSSIWHLISWLLWSLRSSVAFINKDLKSWNGRSMVWASGWHTYLRFVSLNGHGFRCSLNLVHSLATKYHIRRARWLLAVVGQHKNQLTCLRWNSSPRSSCSV